jgi:hypothetical protein
LQRTLVTLLDDLSPDAEVEATHSVCFSVSGTDYEIDLSEHNFKAMEAAFAPYVDAARTVSRTASREKSGGRTSAQRERSRAARQWLLARGHIASERGRIPADKMQLWIDAGQPGA